MKPWNRWQDWARVAVGVWLLVSPWALGTAMDPSSTWNAWIVGALTVIASVTSLRTPKEVRSEWVSLALGAWLLLSPWILGFTVYVNAARNAWVVGAIVVILASLAVPVARRAPAAA
jgi:hypothetical protein